MARTAILLVMAVVSGLLSLANKDPGLMLAFELISALSLFAGIWLALTSYNTLAVDRLRDTMMKCIAKKEDRRIHLKVKIKSLAEEARIIRFEESRQKGRARQELYAHRTYNVRTEQRASYLAYAYIRGKAYRDVEPDSKTFYHLYADISLVPYGAAHEVVKRAARMVRDFGAERISLDVATIRVVNWIKGRSTRVDGTPE